MKQYFSFEGQIRRMPYFLTNLVCSLLLLPVEKASSALSGLALLVLLAWTLAVMWVQLAAAVKRCRDAGFNPWLVLLFLVPIANFVFGLILLFKPTKAPAAR